jgi:glutamate-1-semialdehyde 2,1-aminomutase
MQKLTPITPESSTNLNQILFEQAQQYIPGGVNSPVRAFKAVGGTPLFIQKAKGAYVYDANNTQYIDMVGSWGPMILGHAHPSVLNKISDALQYGLSFGAPTALESQFAQKIIQHMPSIEQLRLVSSGTEATMSAIRLARGYTKRELIIKFAGGYHGHADCLLVKAGSGLVTFGHPTSAGVSKQTTAQTIVLEYNDIENLEQAFKLHADNIAAVIIEPIAGNMNMVFAQPDFLTRLRELCTHHNTVLIFDEVMSGFRVALAGAQSFYGIKPDLTCLGKVIGGGMPLAAFGGRRDIMQCLAPVGDVYQAGTLSGNPIAVTAGLATLELIESRNFFDELHNKTRYFIHGLMRAAKIYNIPFCAQSQGGMFGFYFMHHLPQNIQDMEAANKLHFNTFFHTMLSLGVYLAPSSYEAGFMSIMHTETILDQALSSAEYAFKKLAD